MSKIIVARESSIIGCAKKYKIELDGMMAGELKNGKSLEIDITKGIHRLDFIGYEKIEKSLNVNVDDKTENIHIQVKLKTNACLELTTNENSAIIGNVEEKQQNQINGIKSSNSGIKKTITCRTCGTEISPRAKRCPHCGEMTPGEVVSQTAIGCITAPFIAILIFIAIGFYLGFFGSILK